MNLFRKKPIRIRVERREQAKLRLADWQNDPALCSMAAKLQADPNWQLMLSVLRNEHPAHTALPYGVSMDDRVVLQARAEGYEICLANLEAMARNMTPHIIPESVFLNEEI